jgi:hypothetical protein
MLLCSCGSPSCDPLCDTMLEVLVLQLEQQGHENAWKQGAFREARLDGELSRYTGWIGTYGGPEGA